MLLEIRDLSFSYSKTLVLDSLFLSLETGERVGIVGPSGCGKSTLLRLIAGLERPSRGEIAIDGDTVSARGCHIPPHKRGVSVVFQSPALWSHMTAEKNLAFSDRGAPDRDRILSILNIGALMKRRPHQLSGGEARRVSIARALMKSHKLLLMDEPLINLQPELKESILALLKDLLSESRAGLVYVTHEVGELSGLTDKILRMESGKLSEY